MSFWSLSTGESAVQDVAKEFEVPGGNLDPIPEGSHVLASIDAIKWEKTQDGLAEYVNITWTVLKPEEYKNRKIFHKLWVSDFDPSVSDIEKAKKKRDRNIQMLATIDANAGGKLAKLQEKPSDDQMSFALVSQMMVLGIGEYETPDGSKRGNWVRSIGPRDKQTNIAQPKNNPSVPSAVSNLAKEIGDDIPF